jgi:hypothetical protein
MCRPTIEIELDEYGFHALVADETDNVLWITDSYPSPEDAEHAARVWIDHNTHWPQSA